MGNDDWKMPWEPQWIDEWSKPKPFEPDVPDKQCLHEGCLLCGGTGTRQNGEICVHFISCPCPKCTIMC